MSTPGQQDYEHHLRRALETIKKVRDDRDALLAQRSEPIAIVGMGCRFPGGAESPAAFWKLLEEGRDAVLPLEERWALAGAARPSADVPRWAGLLTGAVDTFDAAFFGISPREAQSLDPQHRLVLEVAWEALEDAGISPQSLHGSRTGVFAGAISTDYFRIIEHQPGHEHDMYGITGNSLSVLAGRLSYTLGLQGPCLSVDTACSSSLVAVHLACHSLRARECDLALSGGINLILWPNGMEALAHTQALSPEGRCKTFDALANGFVRGEGCGLVVLKRLSDAQRDGDRIWAVLRGSAVNQDGRSTGLTAPNVLAQTALLREALKSAHVEPAHIGFVETHGTGTSLGDPIEVEALRTVMGSARPDGGKCVLGAVKTNIGHLEAAAGVAGLIKAALALHHERIPQNLHLRTLNPRLRFEGTSLSPATEPLAWPRSERPRFAGVSSFGISGTNAHVVLEEAPATTPVAAAPARSAELVVLSAKSAAALDAAAARLREHLDTHPSLGLGDVAFSLATTRGHLPHRLAMAATSREALREALSVAAQGQTPAGAVRGRAEGGTPKVVFVFPGQGGQWLGMGRQLLAEEPAFRASIEASERAIQAEAGWSILEELAAEPAASQLGRIDVVQPVLFAVEVALAALWRSWGVQPDAVVGHSMGEVAAAHVAGVLSLEDAVAVICRRSRLLRRISGQGEMAMVELSVAEAEVALSGHEDRLSVAVSNSPRSTVLAGDPAALGEVMAALEAKGVFCRRVKVDVASHSPQVDPLRAELLTALSGLRPQRATMPMRSTVTFATVEGPELGAAYWADNLRQPVRFAQAVQALLTDGHGLFVEMSPHPVLTPAVEEMLQASGQKGAAVGSQRREQPERPALLESLGALYVQGSSMAWERLFPAGGRRVPLPSYPWQRERYWVEVSTGDLKGSRGRAHAGGHPLLGEGQPLSTHAGTRLWSTTLDQERLPWLADHRVQGMVLFPGAGYLEMALSAGADVFDNAPVVVSDVAFVEAMVFADDAALEVQVVTTEESSGRARFQIASRAAGAAGATWTVHARGLLRPAEHAEAPASLDLAGVRERLGEEVPGAAAYAAMTERGLAYGPAFQGVSELWKGDGEALARVHVPEEAGAEAAYSIHPALLDACFQVMAGAARDDDNKKTTGMPVAVGSLRLFQQPVGELWCHARLSPHEEQGSVAGGPRRQAADFCVVDSAGARVATISGLVVQELASRAPHNEQDGWFLELAWEPASAPAPRLKEGRFLLLGEGDGIGSALRAALEAARHTVVHALPGAPDKVPAGCWPVNDTDAAGVRALLGDAFRGQAPTTVVHLRSLDGDGALDGPAIEVALARGCDSVLSTVQALAGMEYRDAPRLWLVTRGAQALGGDVSVSQSPLLGLGRVISLEHPELRCAQVDLDPARLEGEASALLEEILGDEAEQEVARRGGERRVARIVHRLPQRAARERVEPAGGRPFRLEIDEPGVLDHLMLRSTERRAPSPGEVEIAVETAGLNFLDVLLALGVMPNDVPGEPDGPMVFGGECAGRIVAVGEGASGLAVGQPVLALTRGAFASHVTTPAALVVPRPAGLSAPEAAAFPIAYLTAWYALSKVARLQQGERVLIHAATGGVGLAAVQWAQHVGAEVYATAGSPEKRAHLESLGVRHVSDSRSDRFVSDVLAWTGGEGVDVVLNSLSGELIAKSFDLLRSHGRFVELGKRDYYADNPLGLRPFLRNLSFSLVDLRGMLIERPAQVRALFEELLGLIASGVFTPPLVETFPISRAADAFRKMAQAQHMGKLVVTLDEPEVEIHVPVESKVAIRREGSYLVTGGLGGLGLSVAGWLADQGAGHLVLVGRTGAASAEQKAAVAAIEARGARVTVAKVDVADRDQMARVLDDVAASGIPLRGVIHTAGLLDDGLLVQQTSARFRKVMAPKIDGALHLHTLTRSLPLDFFVLYASAAGLFGSPGQGNYAAANAFLDALAHHRRAEGLPALSIDWGAFSEVGLAAAQANRGERLVSRGAQSMTPAEGLTALARLLESGTTQAAVSPFDAQQWMDSYPAFASSAMFSRLLAEPPAGVLHAPGEKSFLERLAAAEPGARTALVQEFLRGEVSRVLRIPEGKLDMDAQLTGLGMDSLMGLELKHRLKRGAAVDVPMARLLADMTILKLGELLRDQMSKRAGVPAEPPKSAVWVDTKL